MFDSHIVIDSVQQNQYSPDWRIMRGKSQMGCAWVFAVLLLCIGGGVAFGSIVGVVKALWSSNALLSLDCSRHPACCRLVLYLGRTSNSP